jgi:hypothetical protein
MKQKHFKYFLRELMSYSLLIKSGLLGQFAEIEPSCGLFLFTSGILEHKIIFCVCHLPSSKYYLVPERGILFRRDWGFLHRHNW